MKSELPKELNLISAFKDSFFQYIPHRKFWADSPNAIRLAVNSIVFESERGLALFDPGPGDPLMWIDGMDSEARRMEFTQTGGLLTFLAGKGSREKVTDIFLTHHHPDHICGLYTAECKREKVFKNAVVWSCLPDAVKRYNFRYLGNDNAYVVKPLPKESHLFKLYQTDIHAPCHTVYEVLNDQKNVIIWGDLLPTAMHLRRKFRKILFPQGSPPFYEHLIEKLADDNSISFLFHDPRRTLVNINRSKFGFVAKEV